MNELRDYQSICAGGEWWSCEYFHNELHFSRVVVFANRRDPNDDERYEVVGLDQVRLNERLNSTLKDQKSFVGYVHSDDFIELGKRLKPEVAEYLVKLEVAQSERP